MRNNVNVEFETTRELVEKLLAGSQKARNSDKYLLYLVMLTHGIEIPYNIFNRIPSAETVRRTRQKIQNEEGKHLPDKQTDKMRVQREQDIRNWSIRN